MTLASPPAPAALEPQTAKRQLWFGRVLIAFCILAGLEIAANFGVMLWGQNEFSQPESIVAAQSMMLLHDGAFYNNLREYPYTVNAYMPVFYLLDAGLVRLGVPVFIAGRFISFAALGGILLVCWRLLLLYSGNRYCAWLGTVLCASTSLLLAWGTVGQVDTLAVFFALTAFYHYSRHRVGERSALLLAVVFAVLAVFTKQTMLAAPTAIFLCLLTDRPRLANWKAALTFGASVAGIVLAGVLGWNVATQGNFLLNTVFANMNPFVFEKFEQHWNYLLLGAGQIILVAAVCARALWRYYGKALLIYLALSTAVFLVTAPKLGSDSNYQIETTILLVLCAALGLDAMDYFKHVFSGSRTWITLLQLPLAIHLVLNFRIAVPFLIARVVKEQMFRQQIADLKPDVPTAGRVVSTDMNAMVRLRGRLDVEPLIYTLMVHAGRIDPMPLQRDLAGGAIPTVILYWDLSKPFDNDPEIPGLPEGQLAEIRKHYKLVRHIPGPYLDGAFLYQPLNPIAVAGTPL
jgi:hypothetical protein